MTECKSRLDMSLKISLSTLMYLITDDSKFLTMQLSTYMHRHIALTSHIYSNTSRNFRFSPFKYRVSYQLSAIHSHQNKSINMTGNTV